MFSSDDHRRYSTRDFTGYHCDSENFNSGDGGQKENLFVIKQSAQSGLLLTVELIMSLSIIVYLAEDVGIISYARDISQKTQIYEGYFVDPDSVRITFPEKKRNLILIYMESMESTYASVQEGGGKEDNYIAQLTRLAEENINFSNSDKLGERIVLQEQGGRLMEIQRCGIAVENLQ